jgi:P27 family predicted phage terminase small subunit
MSKGAKPIPTRLKILTGNPGKRPIREEPVPESPLPAPPSHLNGHALEEWNRISESMHSLGLLYQVDMAAFAAYCTSYGRWKSAEEQIKARVEKGGALAGLVDVTKSGNVIQNVLVGISNKAAADMVRYAAEFGLTPSARVRLAVDTRNKPNKFKGLIGKNG